MLNNIALLANATDTLMSMETYVAGSFGERAHAHA
jgi:hypothetical protein